MSKINKIEIFPESGVIQARIEKTIVKAGTNEEVGVGWHRLQIVPGQDPDAVIAANEHDLVNNQGFSPIGLDDTVALKAYCTEAHTPEKVAAFEKRVRDYLEEQNDKTRTESSQPKKSVLDVLTFGLMK